MTRYTIDCTSVESFENFVKAANAGLIQPSDGNWSGNLDAFNDYLSWPPESEYELEIHGATKVAESLGHAAMAKWLRDTLKTCHPDNVEHLKQRLSDAECSKGQTLFELLLEIIAGQTHVRLVLT